jgi:hypothetical protein
LRYIIEKKTGSSEEIKNKWLELEQGKKSTKSTAAVVPLIQTKWNQAPYYNELCPLDPETNRRTYTGCVATAMAQIMKYWNYPANGTGFHSYNHESYGTIPANFGSTTYNWASMPNSITGSNSAVATLMFHCGVSVDMDYGPDGSGAYTSAIAPALKTYFGYSSSAEEKRRSSYTDLQWKELLKTELDAGRPLHYAGYDVNVGHAFICDGYDINDLFHFNWGWGGSADGYFAISMLNPFTCEFNSNHKAVIGIQPPSGSQSCDMRLYNNVTPSSATISYGKSFSVTTNIANYGSNTFNGDYCAAIFDNSDNFIEYVQILENRALQGGYRYVNDIVFSNSGLLSILPGTYRIGVFYRPAAGNWILIANNSGYNNLVQVTVVSKNDIELNSSLKITPGTTLLNGQPVSVNLNIRNDGSTTFTGDYRVVLFTFDGKFSRTIGVKSGNSLPAGYTYTSPYLTFNTPAVTANPGTYLLAVQHKLASGTWELTGSTYYTNPVRVIVKRSPWLPDAYESNDNIGQASNLPVNFINNIATINTTGSNCHTGSDYDYYKINLAAGYEYIITARLHDSYNSGNGNSYTLDALFTFSTDGTNWSDTFDDVMPGNITMVNGGTVYFKTAPYFSGAKGTYLLDLNITRNIITGIFKNDPLKVLNIYPNPASDFINIDPRGLDKKIVGIRLFNINGQPVVTLNPETNDQLITMTLSHLSDGTYLLYLKLSDGIITRKIIIKK